MHSCGGRSWGCQATAPLGLSGHCTSNRHHHRAAVPLGFAPSPLPPPTGAAALLPRAQVSGYEGSTQRFVLLLSFSFSFRSEIGLCRPVVHRHIIVDTPEYEVVTASSQGYSADARDQATIAGVTAFSGGGATHAAVVKLALDPSPHLLLQVHGHRRRCC